MASAIYPKWKTGLMQATANTSLGGTVKIALMKNTYSYSSAHQFYSDLTPASNVIGGARANDKTLSSKTFSTPGDGTFDAADPATWTAIGGGSTINAVVIYIDDATADASSRLVAYIDNAGTISVPTNGGDISVVFDNTTNRIFSL